MKLDKRIRNIDTIQNLLKYDTNAIGCKGYFFDNFCDTKDLSKCCYGELVDLSEKNDLCFKARIETNRMTYYFRFFIPEDDLEPAEKKYRPFTPNEFLVKFPMLTNITMRVKGDDNCIITCTVTGYRTRIMSIDICLGVEWISLKELMDKYEYKNTLLGVWTPFGEEE